MIYDEPFWLSSGYSGEVVSTGGNTAMSGCQTGPITIFYDATTYKETPVLVGFSAGRNADEWFSKYGMTFSNIVFSIYNIGPICNFRTSEERKEGVVKQLTDYFGPKAKNPLQVIEKDWTTEEYIGGAPVSISTTGHMHNFHLLR